MQKNLQQKIKFHHCVPVQIRFNDIDIAGHVNNAVYFNYFNYGRMLYFNDLTGGGYDWNKLGLVLVNMNVDFYEPIFINDRIKVCTKVTTIGNKSLEMIQHIVKETEEGEIITACCKSVLVGYDYGKKTSLVLPEEWKETIVNFEKNVVLKSK